MAVETAGVQLDIVETDVASILAKSGHYSTVQTNCFCSHSAVTSFFILSGWFLKHLLQEIRNIFQSVNF